MGLIVPVNSNLVPSGLGLPPERMFVSVRFELYRFFFLFSSSHMCFGSIFTRLRVFFLWYFSSFFRCPYNTMDMFPVQFGCKWYGVVFCPTGRSAPCQIVMYRVAVQFRKPSPPVENASGKKCKPLQPCHAGLSPNFLGGLILFNSLNVYDTAVR